MLFLPNNYVRRMSPRYFDDTSNTDQWQDTEYQIAAQYRYERVLDYGCGSAYKLRKYFHNYTGVDVPQTVKWLRENYPDGDWRHDDEIDRRYDLVLSMDVIEHVIDPESFLAKLLIVGETVILSTPERISLHQGPPFNSAHVQEWAFDEFHSFVSQWAKVYRHERTPQNGQLIVCGP